MDIHGTDTIRYRVTGTLRASRRSVGEMASILKMMVRPYPRDFNDKVLEFEAVECELAPDPWDPSRCTCSYPDSEEMTAHAPRCGINRPESAAPEQLAEFIARKLEPTDILIYRCAAERPAGVIRRSVLALGRSLRRRREDWRGVVIHLDPTERLDPMTLTEARRFRTALDGLIAELETKPAGEHQSFESFKVPDPTTTFAPELPVWSRSETRSEIVLGNWAAVVEVDPEANANDPDPDDPNRWCTAWLSGPYVHGHEFDGAEEATRGELETRALLHIAEYAHMVATLRGLQLQRVPETA